MNALYDYFYPNKSQDTARVSRVSRVSRISSGPNRVRESELSDRIIIEKTIKSGYEWSRIADQDQIGDFLKILEGDDEFLLRGMNLDVEYLTSSGKRQVSPEDQEKAWRIIIKTNDANGAKKFLELGGEVNIDNSWYNILFIAIAEHNNDMLKFLIEAGADINWRGMRGYNSLDFSMEVGTYESTKMLVEAGSDMSMMYFIYKEDMDNLPKNSNWLFQILKGENDKNLTGLKEYIDWNNVYFVNVDDIPSLRDTQKTFTNGKLVEEYAELPPINYDDWYLYSRYGGKTFIYDVEPGAVIYHWKTKKYSTDNAILIYYPKYDSFKFVIQSGDNYINGRSWDCRVRISTKYLELNNICNRILEGDIKALGEVSIKNIIENIQKFLYYYIRDG